MIDQEFNQLCSLEQNKRILEALKENNRLLAEIADRDRHLSFSEILASRDNEEVNEAFIQALIETPYEDIANIEAQMQGYKNWQDKEQKENEARSAAIGLDPRGRPLEGPYAKKAQVT